MKTKSKSSKTSKKKPVAKKTKTSTVKSKKAAPKSVKKAVTVKKTKKVTPKKRVKKTGAKTQTVSSARKKKASVKVAKQSTAIRKPLAAGTPVAVIQETVVTSATMITSSEVPSAPPSGLLVGKVTHFYNHSNVAIIELDAGNLRVGDTIHIKGHTTDFEQVVESIEIEHQRIETAEAGQTVGVKVRDVVREHDKVYKKE